MYDLKKLGKKIEEMRKKKGMTQENLAEKLGVTSQAVSKWENSLCYPDIELIPTLCAIFDISLDDIFGKIKKDYSNKNFPQVFKGLKFVYSFNNVGCYSDKGFDDANGSTISFKDGSIAELSSRRIINRGEGKILLRTLDESFVTEETVIPSTFNSLTDKVWDCEFDKVKKLECFIPNGNCVINKSDGNKTKIEIEGYPEFIDLMYCEYKHEEQILKIDYDHEEKDKLNKIIEKWDISKNIIRINIAFDGDTFENLGLSIEGSGNIKLNIPSVDAAMKINGSGDIHAPVSFINLAAKINGSGDMTYIDAENLAASINGSGNIEFNNTKNCAISINGSGDIKFENAEECAANIYGSGDISANWIKNIAAKIHGSGDIKLNECHTINVDIFGSGDFDVETVNKSVEIKIHGSGDVNIRKGEVETFNVNIDNGEVRAKGVTTDRANIEISNNGTVEIGRVKIESIEKCGDNAEIIIHKRG